MRSLFKTLCNNDFGLPGHSIIKHMHYDASGSDQSICGILYQIAKTTTIGILDKSGFLMVDLRPVPRQFRIRSTIHQEENDRTDRKSTRLNSSHIQKSRMPSSA